MSSASQLIELPGLLVAYVAAVSNKSFVSPGGAYAATSLLFALAVAAAFLILRRRAGKRRPPVKVLARALLPRGLFQTASGRADLAFLVFNIFLFGLAFGWTVMTSQFVANAVGKGLIAGFGTPTPAPVPEWLAMASLTLALFLAYELAYWLDHYLSHRIPFLWEFHKVHHSAEQLSPLTNARVHPVDTIVFYNITALMMGGTGGIVQYLLGKPVLEYTLWNTNALALVFSYAVNHLQHSHVWIPFTGVWGKVFLSPAHHQIHHSTNPIHFDKNLGSALSIFDWLFGTLHIPSKQREALAFGVEAGPAEPHSIDACLVRPVLMALTHVLPAGRSAGATVPAGPRQT